MKRYPKDAWERARFRPPFVWCLPCQSLQHQPRPVETHKANFFAQMSGQGLFLPRQHDDPVLGLTDCGIISPESLLGIWIGNEFRVRPCSSPVQGMGHHKRPAARAS